MMTSLPFKVGEYELDKTLFTLKHPLIVRGNGIKHRFEYACDKCEKIYVASLTRERARKHPWTCQNCSSTVSWTEDRYRTALVSGVSEATRELRRVNRQKSSIIMWSDPKKRVEISRKLRERDASVYSRGKSKMRRCTMLHHWNSGEELACVGSYEAAFVRWCNKNQIDFDWQIPHKMPDGRTYIVDAFIKSGTYVGNWVEVKGRMFPVAREKWTWFSSNHLNALLWTKPKLQELGIL